MNARTQGELVSVVMSAYNHADYVGEAIASVLDQSHENIEFLITDDGSSDGSVNAIRAIHDKRINFTPNHSNRGACKAINSLIKKASGRFICMMNSDDLWTDKDKIRKQLDVLKTAPATGACFGLAGYIDKHGEVLKHKTTEFPFENHSRGGWLGRFFFNGNCLCHPSMMIRRECYENIGYYNNLYRQLPDYEFWIRLVKQYDISVINEKWIAFRIVPGRNTSAPSKTNIVRDLNEHYLIRDSFFDDISRKDFVNGFPSVINKINIDREEYFLIEKTLVYFEETISYKEINFAIGLRKLVALMEQPLIRDILIKDYCIDDHWIQKRTGELEVFHKSCINEASNPSNLKSNIYLLQKEIFRAIFKPLKITRRIALLVKRVPAIFKIYKSKLFEKRFAYNKKQNKLYLINKYINCWEKKQLLRKPFPGFHPGVYSSLHELDKMDPFLHYIHSGKPDGKWKCKVISPGKIHNNLNLPISSALQIHVFYYDLAAEIISRLANCKIKPDLLISVNSKHEEEKISNLLSKTYSGCYLIRTVPNKGRDIGPFLTEFKNEISKYKYIGHFHTKVSPHLSNRNVALSWYKFLLENIIGGKAAMVDTIINSFESDPNLGLVFPDDPNVFGWDKNYYEASMLAKRMSMNLQLPDQFNFPAGSMFWARTVSLSPLFELNLDWSDYPEEPIDHDGTMLHAIERLIPFVVKHKGFEVAVSNVPGITY